MNKPEYNIPRVARLRAEGLSQTEIAERTKLSQPTVSRLLSDERAREIIEACRAKLATEAYLQAAENLSRVINEYSEPVSLDENGKMRADMQQRREHGYKASIKVLESVGILPSHAPAQFVANIPQINQSCTCSSCDVSGMQKAWKVGPLEVVFGFVEEGRYEVAA
jgi:transcriptional regulator with XRE-family HTH domain